jgi:hypothetical protein
MAGGKDRDPEGFRRSASLRLPVKALATSCILAFLAGASTAVVADGNPPIDQALRAIKFDCPSAFLLQRDAQSDLEVVKFDQTACASLEGFPSRPLFKSFIEYVLADEEPSDQATMAVNQDWKIDASELRNACLYLFDHTSKSVSKKAVRECYFDVPEASAGTAGRGLFLSINKREFFRSIGAGIHCLPDPIEKQKYPGDPLLDSLLSPDETAKSWKQIQAELTTSGFTCTEDNNWCIKIVPALTLFDQEALLEFRMLSLYRGHWKPRSAMSGQAEEPKNGVKEGICLDSRENRTSVIGTNLLGKQ